MKKKYEELCQKYNVSYEKNIACHLSDFRNMNLAKCALALGTCAVLGKLISSSKELVEVNFDDCLLSDSSLKAILLGLSGSSSVKYVSLNGNNIKGSSVSALSKVIMINKSIVVLSLEWNRLGNSENFMELCNALKVNKNLKNLNLRNNFLTSDNFLSLCSALEENISITCVDLSWNDIGEENGKKLVSSLKLNKFIHKINLQGCKIPENVVSSMNAILLQNMKREYFSKQSTYLCEDAETALTRPNYYTEDYSNPMINIVASRVNHKETWFYVGVLEDKLHSKSLELESLMAKLEIKEEGINELTGQKQVSDKQILSMQDDYKNLLMAKDQSEQKYKMEMHLLKGNHNEKILELQKKIKELEEKISSLKLNLKSTNSKYSEKCEEVFSLNNKITALNMQKDVDVIEEKKKFKERMVKIEEEHMKSIRALQEENYSREEEFRCKLAAYQEDISKLTVNIAALKEQISIEKNASAAQVKMLKQQLLSEHMSELNLMQEELRNTENINIENEKKIRNLTSSINSQKNEISSLLSENSALREEVEVKKSEAKSALSLAQEDVNKLHEENAALKKDITTVKMKLKEVQDVKDEETGSLRNRLKGKMAEIESMRSSESKRSEILRTAFSTYFSTQNSEIL